MPEEKSKKETPEEVSQRIEVESAQAQAAEHAAEVAQSVQAAMPETISEPSQPAPVTGAQEAATGGSLPRNEPVAPVEFSKKTPCPHCGVAGWKSEKALDTHIRFKHLYRGPTGRGNTRTAGGSQPQSADLPPPDFTDITGVEPRFDASNVGPNGLPVLPQVNYEKTAEMTFDLSIGCLTRLFGPEWMPVIDPKTGQDERKAMVEAIRNYYQSIEMPDIPPGYMLCIMVAIYSAPRLQAQPTRTKVISIWLWTKEKFNRLFGRRKPAPPVVKIVEQPE